MNARERLDAAAVDAIHTARDSGLMMDAAGKAMVDAVIALPDEALAVMVEAGVIDLLPHLPNDPWKHYSRRLPQEGTQ